MFQKSQSFYRKKTASNGNIEYSFSSENQIPEVAIAPDMPIQTMYTMRKRPKKSNFYCTRLAVVVVAKMKCLGSCSIGNIKTLNACNWSTPILLNLHLFSNSFVYNLGQNLTYNNISLPKRHSVVSLKNSD